MIYQEKMAKQEICHAEFTLGMRPPGYVESTLLCTATLVYWFYGYQGEHAKCVDNFHDLPGHRRIKNI